MANLWLCWGMAGAACLAADRPISFSRDIQPIFAATCWKCHGTSVQLSKLDLRSRDAALKGGERGAALVPGKSSESRLYRVVAGLEKPAMPMGGKLTTEQVSLIKDWIDQGAPWDATSEAPASAAPVAAIEEMPITAEARRYWAFQKPVQGQVPATPGNPSNPIDAF